MQMTVPSNYSGRGRSYDYEGTNRGRVPMDDDEDDVAERAELRSRRALTRQKEPLHQSVASNFFRRKGGVMDSSRSRARRVFAPEEPPQDHVLAMRKPDVPSHLRERKRRRLFVT